MFILKVIILINNQLLSTANAKDNNTGYYCSDFRSESSGIFLCFGGFFVRQISTFYLAIFDGIFYHSKSSVVLSLNFERYFTSDIFL